MVYRCVAYPSTGSHIIPDDEDNGETRSSPYPLRSPYANRIFLGPVVPTKNLRGENRTDLITDEVLPPVNVIKPDEELLSSKTPQYELLCWHYRIDQLPFSRLRILFLLDIIPRKLLLAKTPKCAGCLYGAMTKRPWRSKGKQANKVHTVTTPGACVSVDQL